MVLDYLSDHCKLPLKSEVGHCLFLSSENGFPVSLWQDPVKSGGPGHCTGVSAFPPSLSVLVTSILWGP